MIALSRSLALGRRYRSGSVLAAMEAASVVRQCWRDAPPELSEREHALVALMIHGLGDREIAGQLGIS